MRGLRQPCEQAVEACARRQNGVRRRRRARGEGAPVQRRGGGALRVRGPLREVGERVVKGGDLRGRDQRGTSLSSGAPAARTRREGEESANEQDERYERRGWCSGLRPPPCVVCAASALEHLAGCRRVCEVAPPRTDEPLDLAHAPRGAVRQHRVVRAPLLAPPHLPEGKPSTSAMRCGRRDQPRRAPPPPRTHGRP